MCKFSKGLGKICKEQIHVNAKKRWQSAGKIWKENLTVNLRSLRAFSHATFQLKGQSKEVILLFHSERKVNGVKEVIFN